MSAFLQILTDYSTDEYLGAITTLIGFIGMFPAGPRVVTRMVRSAGKLGSWAMVFVLVFQGGGGKDIKFSALVTLAGFAITHVLDLLFP